MKLLRFLLVPFFITVLTLNCDAQPRTDSATAVGSTLFKISGSRSFWMGSNYRKEWKTPIRVPVINLATEHGGLTPVRRGGGKQTKSLRLEDPEGLQYTLRSIQKYITSKTLPGDLQSEAAADLVADGVSASYPYSALSIPDLSQAAGIPHGDVRLVYVPDDPRLGQYREDFGNMMALYEARLPDSVKKAFDTEEVVDKLKDDNDNAVDQLALLRIRILDMFVMDLDRHEGQWSWGAYDNGKGKTFFPIAKDRDQAFYINQGLLPGIVKAPSLVPQLEGFKPKAHNINRFNFAARNLDRFFLNGLNEQDWQQTTDNFLSKMTDAVIEKALMRQPAEIQPVSAAKITQTLKDRRQYLAAETMQYYRFISENVDVVGSDKKELFDIIRNNDGSVLLQVYKVTREGTQSVKMYDRKFDPQVTRELRLYGMGGDDRFVVHGNEDKIKIRMIGGSGEDQFENTGTSGKGGIVYDLASGNNKLTGRFKNRLSKDTAVNSYQRLYYKYNIVSPFISFGYNPDDGVYLGPSLKIIRHGFRKTPYRTLHQLAIRHSLATNAYNFHWYSEFISALGKNSDILFDADIKAPSNTSNFFGYGVSTIYDKTKPGKFKYYRARYQFGDISLLLRSRFSEKVSLTLGPTYQFYSMDSADNKNRYILKTGLNGLDPATLFKKQSYFGGQLSLTVDTRDNKVVPRRGVIWQSSLRFLSGITNASYNVTQLNSDFTFHLMLGKGTVIANRFGGGHNFGSFEFYQAQYLGNDDGLLGYRKYRFAGKSRLFNNTELRMKLANLKTYLFPASFGILAFFDTGRIWADNDNSTKWVSGYGGGFWFAPLNRLVITISYAGSKEDKIPMVGMGWRF